MSRFALTIWRLWLAGALLLLTPPACLRAQQGDPPDSQAQAHRVVLFHTHTGERIDIVYRVGEQYLPDAIAKLDTR